VEWRTLYGIITGRQKAGKKASRLIDAWYEKNESEVLRVVDEGIKNEQDTV
jgi:hypothetical protein